MPTKRQKQILDFVRKFIEKNEFSPSYDEIKKHFGLSSFSTIHFHIEKLKEAGYLDKEDNTSRSLSLNQNEQLVQIPILGKIAAGQPIEAIAEKETIAIPKSKYFAQMNIFGLKVQGNSMIDEQIENNDIVIIKSQQNAENGQKVVALINNNEVTLKKIYRGKNYVRLQPANDQYEPIFVKPENLSIQGIVVDVLKTTQNTDPQPDLGRLANKKIYKNDRKNHVVNWINKIQCIDCVKGLKKLPDNCIDLTVTSPPYDDMRRYKGYNFDFANIAKQLFRVTKKGGVVVWIVGDQTIKGDETGSSFRQALFFKKVGFNLFDTMIYLKTPRGAVGNNKTYWQAFEYMFVLSKGSPKTINLIRDRENKDARDGDNGTKRLHDGSLLKQKRSGYSKFGRRTNVWEYLIGKGHSASDDIAYKHPAIFPEKLVQDHIRSWTNLGDVVLDPMCGSGTTCKIAKLHKRDFIGMDISPEYCKIAEERINQIALL